jgi:adenine-specific DNA-methyltransferase
MIINNLRAAGVQNTVKNERLKFTYLEPYAGIWLQAVGNTMRKMARSGAWRSLSVLNTARLVPTLSRRCQRSRSGPWLRSVGGIRLCVRPHVSEESKRYGKLTVLPARINPDLQMGGALLKNTGYGNLFMVFGEPDIAIQNQPDGQITVTIKGVDVYDPTTGEIRSSSTDDIACWFIDTNYNAESFFFRHAYFTGADEPYEKLKRALRAEIDEAAWSALYSTTSYPFEKPETGKIAVKVINHYGDEVLKVYPI